MTRQPHDQFAKQYLEELLEPVGTVEISREVPGEVRQIDVWFAPNPLSNRQNLGLLGQLVSRSCLLEPFRNQPSKTEIRGCLLKLFEIQRQLQRRARREELELPEAELPRLWILATSASATLIDGMGAKLDLSNWPNGVYFAPEIFKTALVAINQLPATPETLWLRILGKGVTQETAINELIALPPGNPLRRNILELIYSWRANIESRETLTEDDQELIMGLSPAYLQAREELLRQGRLEGRLEGIQEGILEGILEGRQEGRLEERRLMVENLLRVRFGSLDEQLSRVVSPLLQLPPEEFSLLLLQLDRSELLARFGSLDN